MKRNYYFSLIIMLALIIVGSCKKTAAQKLPLDTTAIRNWPLITGEAALSNDGRYAWYIIKNQPAGKTTLTVRQINGAWDRTFIEGRSCVFTTDNRKAFLVLPGDSLDIITLGSRKEKKIPGVKDFIYFSNNKIDWLAYRKDEDLIMHPVDGKLSEKYENVLTYYFSEDKRTLILLQKERTQEMLTWIGLKDGKVEVIWKGEDATNVLFDKEGKQVLFIAAGDDNKNIWRYREGETKAEQLFINGMQGFDSSYQLAGLDRVSIDGKRLFLKYKKSTVPPPPVKSEQKDYVTIWAYHEIGFDLIPRRPTLTKAVLNFNDQRVIRLENDNERFFNLSDELGFVEYKKGDILEDNWNDRVKPARYIVDCKSGKRWNSPIDHIINYGISPNGRNIIGSDSSGNLLCLNMITKEVMNISDKFRSINIRSRLYVAGWKNKRESVILCDEYDIWELPLSGETNLRCLTGENGRKKNIQFRLIANSSDTDFEGNNFYLSAFDLNNKKNGFYHLTAGKSIRLESLTMDDVYYCDGFSDFSAAGGFLRKAKNAQVWITTMESAKKSFNLYSTSDFKYFQPISSLYPEAAYQWLYTELVNYTTEDGRNMQGILYKPDNFDSTRKYPLIIHYYEKKSHLLNNYLLPGLSSGGINIPWFVSRGYLVFTPDICEKVGAPGEEALKSVVSGAKRLKDYSWIDANNIGLQGHSWGGFETNYIITHSNLFKAAMSASGSSDLVSMYGSLFFDHPFLEKGFWSLTSLFERGQMNMGDNLWKIREKYINSSPIFNADLVTTPILLMNNKLDAVIPFNQGVEFFNGLRRLRKKVWLLQYEGERHALSKEASKFDFTMRLEQFFGHYLKNEQMPEWMKEK